MIFSVVITVVILLLSTWNLLIAVMGLFQCYRATAPGVLLRTQTYKNVQVKGGKIPVLTRYTYAYIVNGKSYRYTGEGMHTRRALPQRAAMVYVKGFPRHAYPDKFRGINEWAIGLSTLAIGLMFIFVIAFA